MFTRVEAYNNGGSGILLDGSASTGAINATVADSLAAGNGIAGFWAFSPDGQSFTSLLLVRSVAAANANGIRVGVGANATLRVGQSTISGHTKGWLLDGSGVLQSYGNNKIDGNGDGDPPIATVIARK